MQISDLVGQYHYAVSSGAEKVTGTKGVENLVSSLKSLTKGNIFEGTVSSVKNGKVTLALSNGTQLTARLDGKVPLSEGQSMFFQVKANDGSTVSIRPFSVDGNGVNYTLLQALSAAGLPAESGYLSMVDKMMEEQMPIDRASLQQMARLVNTNGSIDVRTLVQMSKLGIEITPEHAAQFENYLGDRQAITAAIDSLIDGLPTAMQGSGLSGEALRQMNSQVLSVITEAALPEAQQAGTNLLLLAASGERVELVAAGAQSAETAATGAQSAETAPAGATNTQGTPVENFDVPTGTSVENFEVPTGTPVENFEVPGAAGETADAGAVNAPNASAQNPEVQGAGGQTETQITDAKTEVQGAGNPQNTSVDAPVGNPGVQADTAVQGASAGTQNAPDSAQGAAVAQNAQSMSADTQNAPDSAQGAAVAQNAQSMSADIQNAPDSAQGAAVAQNAQSVSADTQNAPEAVQPPVRQHTLAAVLDSAQREHLNTMLKELVGQRAVHYDGTKDVNALLNDLRELLDSNFPVRREPLSRLLASREFKALVKDGLERQWTIRPEELTGSDKINKLYGKLDRQMERISQVLRATGQESANFAQTAADIRSNVEFMNQINQAYAYVQIPLKMSGQTASGELYVYTNKKSLMEGDKELTAFLHLDMDNLGPTDISVKLLHREVSTSFYLENDAAYHLLEKHLPILEERLKVKGYNCKVSVINETRHVNFVEDFLKKDQPSAGRLHRYSFDMRA